LSDNEISITIDGVGVKTAPGKTVLEAAIEAGVYIPYLCYHPGMKPFGACRMCVVDVENGQGFPASCTLPVAEGMVIKNTSREVQDLRRNIMDMLLAEHPHGCLTCHRVDLCGPQDVCLRHVSVNDRCVTCPKNERCELKDTARFLGMDMESPLQYQYRDLPVETGDPFYDIDYNLCIVCGRCVRVCEEVRGDNAITFTERAGKALVGTSFGTSLLESGCEFCGACLDVCPVGALVESDHKWEKAERVERTICSFCPVGCQVNLEVGRFERVIRSVPELNSPANRGQACFKGKFGMDFVNGKGRLKSPRIRRNGELQKASWEEALDYLAERLPGYKGSAFALLTAPDSTNEEHYLAQKFARVVMGTNNVDQASNTRPGLVEPLRESLGYSAATNPLWELEEARCIMVFNANLTEEHNVVGVPIKRAVKKGTRLIVIDPREVELTRHAHLWLKPRPGTELLLLGAILKEITDQGLERREWLEENCDGLEELRRALASVDIENVVRETGVSKDQIDRAVRIYAPAEPSTIVYGLDGISRDHHSSCVSALSALALLTGNLGRASAGLLPLRRGANEQGAWDVGCLPNLLPGYVPVADTDARKRLGNQWGVEIPSETGLDLHGIIDGARSGRVRALFLVGDGAGLTNGEVAGAEAALEALELLVVQDTYLGHIAEKAHVVLPRATFAEKQGTYTNLERRVQLLRPVIKPKVLSEGEALEQLAQKMDAKGFDFESPAEVMEEIASLTPIYGGVSHQRLQSEGRLVFRPDTSNPLPTQILYSDREYRGLQWPCPSAEVPGTPVLYSQGFADRKAHIRVPDFVKMPMNTDEDHPFIFVPGRVLLQSDREMKVIKGQSNSLERDELVEVHQDDADMLGIKEGDLVEVRTKDGALRGRALFAEEGRRGVVSTTLLFGQLMVDLAASSEPNPMAKVPSLTVAPAALIKIEEP
jgi:formate dehydrogenase alpha subunit